MPTLYIWEKNIIRQLRAIVQEYIASMKHARREAAFHEVSGRASPCAINLRSRAYTTITVIVACSCGCCSTHETDRGIYIAYSSTRYFQLLNVNPFHFGSTSTKTFHLLRRDSTCCWVCPFTFTTINATADTIIDNVVWLFAPTVNKLLSTIMSTVRRVIRCGSTPFYAIQWGPPHS